MAALLGLGLAGGASSCQIVASTFFAGSPKKVVRQSKAKSKQPSMSRRSFSTPRQAASYLLKASNQRDLPYQTIDTQLSTSAQQGLKQLLDGPAPRVDALPLQLEQIHIQGQEELFDALYEESTKPRQGLPLLLLRNPKASAGKLAPWILQAPHRYFDRHSAQIATRIFFLPQGANANANALMVNTRHRYAQAHTPNGERRAHNPSDVAHNAQHPFNALTQILLQHHKRARVVQIHGFSDSNPKLPPERKVWGILSSGNRTSASPVVRRLTKSLNERFGDYFFKYPEEIKTLGGTTNVQGKLASRYASDLFVHMELSAAFRKKLIDEPQSLDAFAQALFDAMSLGIAP